jgi:phage recombination protein Bet
MPQRPDAVTPAAQTDVAKWNAEEMGVLTNLIAKDCNPVELSLFSNVCHKTGLDPFSRQIYAIKRGGKMTIQTSIDGFRAIAEDTGQYAGNDDAVFDGGLSLAEHIAKTKNPKTPPVTATVTVFKVVGGQRCPFTASAAFEQYAQKKSPMWSSMPHTMIAKCAEALALRKAFPRKLSGLYTGDEMEQADNPQPEQIAPVNAAQPPQAAPAPPAAPKPAKPATDAQMQLIARIMASHVITEPERQKLTARMDRGMAFPEASNCIEWLQSETAKRKKEEKQAAPAIDVEPLTPDEHEQINASLEAAGI